MMKKKVFQKLLAVTLALSMLLWPTALAKEGTLTGKGSPSDHSTSAIKARGVMTIASESQSALDYIIPNDPEKYGDLAGTRGGAVPEVARQIAKELGVKAVFVEYDTVEEVLRATASGEVDMAAGAFLITDEREALYQMTDSYDIVGEEVFSVYLSTKPQSGSIPKNEAELGRARIGVVKGTGQARYTGIQYPQATLVQLPDNQAVLDAIASGDVDAGVFTAYDQVFIDLIMDAYYDGKLTFSIFQVRNPDYRGRGMVLMKGNEEFCSFINRFIYNVREDGWLLECFKTKELEAVELGFQSASSMQYQNLHMEVGNCPSLDYSDLNRDAWYHQCVDYALENDLMTGMGGGIFSPNGTLTRAEAVTVLWKLENKPQVSYQLNFEDVAEGQWFTEMVRWAVSKKIMAGNGDGTFGPNSPITREQLAAVLYRYAAYKKYDVSAKGNLSSFTDASKISGWANEAMQWAYGTKLMQGNGDGTINPTGNTKRCEFASMIMKFNENIAAG